MERNHLDPLKPAHRDRRENDAGRTVSKGQENYDSATPQAATTLGNSIRQTGMRSLCQKALVLVISFNVQIFRKVNKKRSVKNGLDLGKWKMKSDF